MSTIEFKKIPITETHTRFHDYQVVIDGEVRGVFRNHGYKRGYRLHGPNGERLKDSAGFSYKFEAETLAYFRETIEALLAKELIPTPQGYLVLAKEKARAAAKEEKEARIDDWQRKVASQGVKLLDALDAVLNGGKPLDYDNARRLVDKLKLSKPTR